MKQHELVDWRWRRSTPTALSRVNSQSQFSTPLSESPATIHSASLPSDAYLLATAKAGDENAFEVLLQRYMWLVRAKARGYFLQGAEYEDLIQEGVIGLFKAVRDFRGDSAVFRAFADLCIARQIITAVKSASRQKHVPLNSALSFEAPSYKLSGDLKIRDVLGDNAAPFESVLLQSGEVKSMLRILQDRLSRFEYRILLLWLEGCAYEEIARRFRKSIKSVDDGLWRVKCKMRRMLAEGILSEGDN